MRINVEIGDLSEQEWTFLQQIVQTSYELAPGQTRVCLTFARGEETRHVEMPLGALNGVMIALNFRDIGPALSVAMEAMSRSLEGAVERMRRSDTELG